MVHIVTGPQQVNYVARSLEVLTSLRPQSWTVFCSVWAAPAAPPPPAAAVWVPHCAATRQVQRWTAPKTRQHLLHRNHYTNVTVTAGSHEYSQVNSLQNRNDTDESQGLWRWCVAINSTITLDIVHRLGYLLETSMIRKLYVSVIRLRQWFPKCGAQGWRKRRETILFTKNK
jgi:hypothetical protein